MEKIVYNNWQVDPHKKIFNYNELLFIIQEMLSEEGKKYFEPGLSQRGHHVFRAFVKHLLYRNIANFDSMVLITSEKGMGKSSAGIMLAREWCKLLGMRFNPARHIAYNNADVMQKIDLLNKFEPILCLGQNTRIRLEINGKETSDYIKNLVGRNDYKVLTYNIEKNIFEYQKPKETILTKYDKTYEIELENGIKINATKNHMFLTKEGIYKKVEELTENDELVLQSKKCKICGKEYFNQQWDSITCSEECSNKNKKNQLPYRLTKPIEEKIWRKNYYKNNLSKNLLWRIKHNLNTRMIGLVSIHTKKGKDRTLQIIGCTIEELKLYLEKQFKDGMSWGNYGHKKGQWSIDHIIPCCNFDLMKDEDRKKCFHYSNIQPLWNNKNSGKGRWYKK